MGQYRWISAVVPVVAVASNLNLEGVVRPTVTLIIFTMKYKLRPKANPQHCKAFVMSGVRLRTIGTSTASTIWETTLDSAATTAAVAGCGVMPYSPDDLMTRPSIERHGDISINMCHRVLQERPQALLHAY